MKRNLKPLILATIAALSLTGCSDGIVEDDKTPTVAGSMFIRHKLSGGYSILEERDTGICYLEFQPDYHQYGITIMLNPDGTPKKWEYAGG